MIPRFWNEVAKAAKILGKTSKQRKYLWGASILQASGFWLMLKTICQNALIYHHLIRQGQINFEDAWNFCRRKVSLMLKNSLLGCVSRAYKSLIYNPIINYYIVPLLMDIKGVYQENYSIASAHFDMRLLTYGCFLALLPSSSLSLPCLILPHLFYSLTNPSWLSRSSLCLRALSLLRVRRRESNSPPARCKRLSERAFAAFWIASLITYRSMVLHGKLIS